MAIDIGIIGCGKITERLIIPNFKDNSEARLVGLVDIKKERAERLINLFGLKDIKVYTDWKKLISEKDIKGIIVATPPPLHREMTVLACNAKKHVLVEKPMAISLKDADLMVDSANKNKTILMVEQTQRFDPVHEVVKEVLESGILGKINMIKGRLGHSGPEYWNSEDKWYVDKRLSGGGALMDVGIHIMDLLRWLYGREVSEVCANVGTVEKNYTVEDNGSCLLRFEDGALGTFEASWTTRPYEVTTAFYGEKGKLFSAIGKPNPVVLQLGNPKERDPNIPWSQDIILDVPSKSKHISPIHYFVDCILKNRKPFISGEEGRKSLEVILAAYESARIKKWVRLPLKEGQK